MQAIAEAARMEIFAVLIISKSLKARLAIKMDIVKPIPPKRLTPKICFQLTPLGNFASPDFIIRKLAVKIPSGFPITNPTITPRLVLLIMSVSH